MSARLKLKKLTHEIEYIRTHCRMREYEANLAQLKYHRLLKQNIQEIEACVELYPYNMRRDVANYLNANVRKVADSIVRKYSEQLAEHIIRQLMTKYWLNNFSAFSVRLLAPAITEEHIEIDVRR